jgi:hypothetical protein
LRGWGKGVFRERRSGQVEITGSGYILSLYSFFSGSLVIWCHRLVSWHWQFKSTTSFQQGKEDDPAFFIFLNFFIKDDPASSALFGGKENGGRESHGVLRTEELTRNCQPMD